MRINRILIENFRVYKGKNEIHFDKPSANNNISIIAGQNGFGKTTFLTALVWGFYGKFIADVDDKYKREIYEVGGYKRFASSILNRDISVADSAEKKFKIEIELSEILIPSVPCDKIVIKREYNVETDAEKTSILIDGFENELTKEVGSDIFVNDFILPKEIAKFFLFDAEKIVTLAEIRTVAEKRKLSGAYSEVLGISKYENLKKNLENLRVKLRKKSASAQDRKKLESLQEDVKKLEEFININEEKINYNISEINRNTTLSEQFQEKLIREGNSMTVDDLISQKKLRDTLRERSIEIKNKLKELLELAPFAIAGNKLTLLRNQIESESSVQNANVNNEFVKTRLIEIKKSIEDSIESSKHQTETKDELIDLMYKAFAEADKEQTSTLDKVLLDLSSEQTNEFNAMYENIKGSFSKLFRQIAKEEKDNRIFLTKTLRNISNAEAKDTDELARKYKAEKSKVDGKIKDLNADINKLYEEQGRYQQELTTKNKLISELSKTVSLDELDDKKDKVTERLISQISEFIYEYKLEKKQALQNRLIKELKSLMHKENFIDKVDVDLNEDYIDIHLTDFNGNIIEKETLSKGEQQLYATALLKSLVDESGIKFPIFIDSPLQKFDKRHSKNIITNFYPSISEQVILFPLLEKELTEKEYMTLMPYVSQAYIIQNNDGASTINEFETEQLFNEIQKINNVYTY